MVWRRDPPVGGAAGGGGEGPKLHRPGGEGRVNGGRQRTRGPVGQRPKPAPGHRREWKPNKLPQGGQNGKEPNGQRRLHFMANRSWLAGGDACLGLGVHSETSASDPSRAPRNACLFPTIFKVCLSPVFRQSVASAREICSGGLLRSCHPLRLPHTLGGGHPEVRVD